MADDILGIVKTRAEILEVVKEYIEDSSCQFNDWNVGSVLRTISESFSDVGHQTYVDLYFWTLQAFDQYAQGQFLDLLASSFGLTRKAGTYAYGSSLTVTISPSAETVTIPAGTRVSTSEPTPRFYHTTQDIVIAPGDISGTSPIQADILGMAYNLPAYYISNIIDLAGIVKVENTQPVTGGEDTENDLDFRTRYLTYKREALARATRAAIWFGAVSVDGVQSAHPEANLVNHWERYPYLKFKYSGAFQNITDSALHYGIRKEGTGTVTITFWGSKARVHLWKHSTYGECTLTIDGTAQTVDLEDTQLRKLIVEHEFSTEGFHTIVLNAGANIGSIECVDVLANYLSTFFVYVDDGTGAMNWETVRTVYEEMDKWGSITGQYFVNRCEIKHVDLSVTINPVSEASLNSEALKAQVQSAVTSYVNTLRMGNVLYASQVHKAVLEQVTGVKNVIFAGFDIVPEQKEIIRARTIEVKIV